MELYQDIQNAVLETLRGKFSETVYNLWFKDLVIEEISGTAVTLSAVSSFKEKMVTEHHLDTLTESFEEILGYRPCVKVTVRAVNAEEERIRAAKDFDRKIEETEEEEDRIEKEEMTRNIEGKDPVSGYTFENFVVGDSNKFAHAACYAVAQSFTTDEETLTNPLEEKYNPLFIYGPSGLGKTHLLYAITNEIKHRTPDVHILYIRGEDFVNEFIDSIRRGTPSDFRAKYRGTDVLLIDDIHVIAGKESIQEEFFNTFNALYDNQKQIILTSDRPPREIQNLADRLRTRFEWGLTADIQPPTPELRAAIIKMKAEKQGIRLSDDIIGYMAANIKSNIRTIEGAIRKLRAMNVLTGTPISLESAKRALSDVQSGSGEISYTIDRIFNVVSKHYDIPVDTIKGKRRLENVVYARRVCMFLIRKLVSYPLTDIGVLFDCKHSNVILACNTIENMMESDPKCKEEIDSLCAKIKN